ncbi:DUF1120 domain-containing protein [Bordetella sp. 15P40C-2]|uniref:DUF1120 domain-containing protein n=1 Tax=Bordetella sp. 15P40C-2 TaxID=2572246 RepID=UPI001323ED1A|nr:DUF1120 domain-containing protein [Bordetella sp. 15P40C-2]MVW72523.1 DUF1120 domain-containing protein [Bordetella sp. 15P40C-2]
MKRTLLSLALAATALSPMLATAASSVQMKVTGTIFPASCEITMPGGTTVDYGKIASGSLSQDKATLLGDDVRANIQVSCDAPTMFAIKPTDARSGTAIASTGKDSTYLYGLGQAGGVNVGAYTVSFVNAKGDGKTVNVIRMDESGKNPAKFAEVLPNKLSGFGDGSGSEVVPHKLVTTDVKMATYVEKASALPLTGDIKLDGLTTFELVYL